MASFTINIPDDKVTVLLDSIAHAKGYDETSIETKAEFAKRWLQETLVRIVKQAQKEIAAKTAADASNIDAEITVT